MPLAPVEPELGAVKKLPENAGQPEKPRSITALRFKECPNEMDAGSACYKDKQTLATSPP